MNISFSFGEKAHTLAETPKSERLERTQQGALYVIERSSTNAVPRPVPQSDSAEQSRNLHS